MKFRAQLSFLELETRDNPDAGIPVLPPTAPPVPPGDTPVVTSPPAPAPVSPGIPVLPPG
jgi:hypothetical protein